MSTRRSFLKKSILGVPAILQADVRQLVEPESLGVAILGLGRYAEGWVAPAVAQSRYTHVAGIITGSPNKVEKWQSKYSIPDGNVYSYGEMDQIAKNDAIDVVYVVTPPGTHADFTIRALEAGKHVICEKPMAVSTEECDRMIEVARRNQRMLQIGYRLYWDPWNVRVMTAMREKEFGAGWTSLDTRVSFNIKSIEPDHWMLNPSLCLGGALSEVGVYAVQAAIYSSQELPIAVRAKSWTDRPELFSAVSEHWEWELEWSRGRTSTHFASLGRDTCVELKMTLPKGELFLDNAYNYDGQTLVTPQGQESFTHIFQQKRQVEGQALAILGRHPVLTLGEMGRRDLYVLESVRQSAQSGEVVSLDQYRYY